MVMYFGRVVEIGDTDSIFERAEHPYTKRLLSAVPGLEGGVSDGAVAASEGATGGLAAGEVEASGEFWQLDGCTHGPDDPAALQRLGPDHFVACHHTTTD